jgi:8-oxo-dGTP diphosphatase
MPTKPFGFSVAALLTDASDRWLLIRRSLDSVRWPGAWDLPGGKMEAGETVETALRREVREETGLEIELQGLAGATEFELPHVRVIMIVLRARALAGAVRLDGEHDGFRWVEPPRAAELPLSEPIASVLRSVRARDAGGGSR